MIHLRGVQADVVIDTSFGVPVIAYWGSPLGDVDTATIVAALARPLVSGGLDVVAPLSVVPEHGSGHQGRPGLTGHRRGGTAWAPRFQPSAVAPFAGGVEVTAVDPVAQLRLVTRIVLDHVLAVSCTVVNEGTTRYLLDGLHPTLPVPAHAGELLTFDGRWARELQPVRRAWRSGAWVSENRAGRTSHEHPPFVFAGEPGFGEWRGEVWGVHLAWSGNHSMAAECLPDGRRCVQAGELLHPGEVCLDPGQAYESPTVLGVFSSSGLTPASWGFHRSLRTLPVHPSRPRPVLLNTWEAVYFDHDTHRLQALASAAAALGIERFVLDDGWFGSRRDDTRGLGDWTVSADVYPDGLAPLIEHVRGLGMEFGIWVEPEMVNPDSDLFRAHPEWVLADAGYEPVLGRHQLVLNLAEPAAFDHVFRQLDALLRDHDIAFVKWDMNRNHVQGSGGDGAAGSSAQTRAFYRLVDALRAAHPGVEIESCASGGGRIDHEVLRRTERVWTSDCNDPLERQTIQWGASMLIPYELMGAHIGPTRSHTTGRTQSLAFRALTAMFGHLGVEWDVLSLSESERTQLAAAIALHRRFRELLHAGDVVRFDPVFNGDAAASHSYGVYAADRRAALVAHAQLTTGMSLLPPPLRLPGLLPDVRYVVEQVPLPGARVEWTASGVVLTGTQLAAHGIQLPRQHPESGLLLHLRALHPT
ncbi:MAG: alpha-galactosidase [Actinomycetota bacterium]|nr:alpha-galactosidase [Actinomycetota bacterium]